MRVAPENIFPGARIRLGEKIFYVIKVNSKSFYASKLTYLNYIEKYNSRAKGVTFSAFCKANDIQIGNIETERGLNQDEIKYLLYEAEDNALLDCLDYAPVGVLELIKEFSLEKMPNTTAKIKAINQKLNINLNKIIEMMRDDDDDVGKQSTTNGRRTAPVVLPEKKEKYKVVSK